VLHEKSGAVTILMLLYCSTVSAATLADALRLCRQANYTEALAILTPLASSGDANAATWLAWLYDGGLGVDRDAVRAATLYRAAAEKGVRLAQTALAAKYWKGDGVERSMDRGRYWIRKAAAAEDEGVIRLLQEGELVTMIEHRWYDAPSPRAKRRVRHRAAQHHRAATLASFDTAR